MAEAETTDTEALTITVPEELVAAAAQVLGALSDMVQLDGELKKLEADAKKAASVPQMSAAKQVRAAWENAVRPGLQAVGKVLAMQQPEGVGAIVGKQAQMARDIMLGGGFGGASVTSGARKVVGFLAARVGLRKTAQLVVNVAKATRVGAVAAVKVVARVRTLLPAAVAAALAAGFTKCAQVTGVAVGALAALKLAGSPMGKAALRDAAPWLVALGVFLYLSKGR